jgi:hypothetical protein
MDNRIKVDADVQNSFAANRALDPAGEPVLANLKDYQEEVFVRIKNSGFPSHIW